MYCVFGKSLRQVTFKRTIFEGFSDGVSTRVKDIGNKASSTTMELVSQASVASDELVDVSSSKTIDRTIDIMDKLEERMSGSKYEGTKIIISISMGPFSIGVEKIITNKINE